MTGLSQRRLSPDDRVLDDRAPCACEACGFVALAPPDRRGHPCPWCGVGDLAPSGAFVAVAEPERRIPFLADPAAIRAAIVARRRRAWLADPGFDPDRLVASLERVWVPMWLVDATVSGRWSAEVGFEIEVRSSDERLEGGAWVSREVTRTKLRWEPRIGTVTRRYDNAAAPACRAQAALEAALGPFDLTLSEPIGGDPGAGVVLAPDRSPEEAWAAACVALDHAVAADCARATGAAQVRGVEVEAERGEVHATWVLLPVGSAVWVDEAGHRRVVRIHGVTGRVDADVPASWGRAARWALVLGGSGLLALLLATITAVLGVVLVPLLALAPVLAIVGGLFVVAAVVPLILAGIYGPSRTSAAGSRRL